MAASSTALAQRGNVTAAATFVAAIFVGEIYFGITIPVAVLLVPALLLIRAAAGGFSLRAAPAGLRLLGLLAGVVLVQFLLGRGPRGRSDLVVYLPFVYAALAMITVHRVAASDRALLTALLAGGAVAGAALLVSLAFGSLDQFPVPGQDPRVTAVRGAEVRDRLAAESNAPPTGRDTEPGAPQPTSAVGPEGSLPPSAQSTTPPVPIPKPELAPAMRQYYIWKIAARTALGMNNYLAVIFVFLFNVALYTGRRAWAALFVVLAACTLSRTSAIFIAGSLLYWAGQRATGRRTWLLRLAGIGLFLAIVTAPFLSLFVSIPGVESLGTRAWFATTGLDAARTFPLFGAPRSEIMRTLGYEIGWNPHNSVLYLTVTFGLIGAAIYAVYAGLALRAMWSRARESSLWTGLAVATSVTLVWSLTEIIVSTPAFEMLLASLYALALGNPLDRGPAAAAPHALS